MRPTCQQVCMCSAVLSPEPSKSLGCPFAQHANPLYDCLLNARTLWLCTLLRQPYRAYNTDHVGS